MIRLITDLALAAIQLAQLQRFSPIITTSSLKHTDYLKSLGATHVLDRSLPPADILAQLPELTAGEPIVYAYDAISAAETQCLAYDALASGGGLVVTKPRSAVLAEREERDGGSKTVAGPYASLQWPGNVKLGEELYARLTEWLEEGIVVVGDHCCRLRLRVDADFRVVSAAEQD